MKILICGGAGFIGSNFILYLAEKYPDYNIINLDKLNYAANLKNVKKLEGSANYKFIKGDICDKNLVFDLVKDVDVVVNFAAETHVDRSIMDSSIFIKSNVQGTQVLLEAAKEYDKRFHHISTDEVFGALGPDDPSFDEMTPYNPRNPYSASKAAADHLVRAYFHTFKVPVTISNCSNNYGPYQFPEKIIPLFICNLFEDKKVPVYGDGQQIRDWIHVDDHVRGIDMIIHKGKEGETYCLGGKDSEITNLYLTKTLIQLMDKDDSYIEYVKDRPGHDRRYSIDYGKIASEMGWEPLIGFKDGLRSTVDWYQNNKNWIDDVRSGDYRDYYKKQYINR
ncbi:MAG: dTDP-glucose 4,6-dehydratase [Candidatus Magasanikbacteria bacterium]|nr:dTDP-glucose 4,6-dehydratase [Candidatus Magasanikbacteria bacterium]